MLNKLSAEEKRIIIILVMMSFFSGIFISYYVSYISAIFVKIAGVDNLPLAYIVSGLGGMLLTSIFNKFELKYSLNGITIILLPIIATSVLLVWYSCTNFGTNKLVIFFSYAWFWIVGNFILLLFKLQVVLYEATCRRVIVSSFRHLICE
jgi:predicted MFS family arabinose efflux permease